MTPERALARAQRDREAWLLRRVLTATETRAWWRLRRRQLGGRKFRRQVPIGPYVVDFACVEAHLVVELDGPHHAEQHDYDRRRDDYLTRAGWTVLRFSVAQVDNNLDAVVDTIAQHLAVDGPRIPSPC